MRRPHLPHFHSLHHPHAHRPARLREILDGTREQIAESTGTIDDVARRTGQRDDIAFTIDQLVRGADTPI